MKFLTSPVVGSALVGISQKLLRGLERQYATCAILQRARIADPNRGVWEAADLQWWWRRPRTTDDLALPVWFDDVGPVAAVGMTAWNDGWQIDAHVVPSTLNELDIWEASLEAASAHAEQVLQVLLSDHEEHVASRLLEHGFTFTSDVSGTTWMHADERPPVSTVEGFRIVDREQRTNRPHPMIERNGDMVASRLRECSLYDPTLDLAVEDEMGNVAGYALFWFDETTLVGLVEPMRVEDDFQRRGLARMLLTNGLERLARKGARRLKVGFATDAARDLYVGAGFIQTSVERVLSRPAPL